MSARPSLLRSIPFWILVVGSVIVAALGAWLTVNTLQSMTVALQAGSATPVDVYPGQVWAIFGGILFATGLLGLALALVVAVIRSFVPVSDVEFIEALEWSEDEEPAVDAPPTQATQQ